MKLFDEYTLRKAIEAASDKGDPDAIIETIKVYNDAVKSDNERRELERRGNLWLALCVSITITACTLLACIFLM